MHGLRIAAGRNVKQRGVRRFLLTAACRPSQDLISGLDVLQTEFPGARSNWLSPAKNPFGWKSGNFLLRFAIDSSRGVW
jgi:hypothetical protein